MARRVKLRKNPGPSDLPYGEWIPAHAVKFNEDGSTSIMAEHARANSRRRNVAAGYYDEAGVFRPIRASWDYDPSRAGERRPKGFKKGTRGKRYSAARFRRKKSTARRRRR